MSFPSLEQGVSVAFVEASRWQFSGVIATRDIYTSPVSMDAHRHEFVAVTIPLSGRLSVTSDEGQCAISGPSAIAHPAGGCHDGSVDAKGSEFLELAFDTGWLRHIGLNLRLERTFHWCGGKAGAAAAQFARFWTDSELNEANLARATREFFETAIWAPPPPRPAWLERAQSALAEMPEPSINQLAKELGLNPAWLGQAYRSSAGEGIRDTIRRLRVDRAISLLRFSEQSLADIAASVGFFDQSHMNRCFRRQLGRTPLDVRTKL